MEKTQVELKALYLEGGRLVRLYKSQVIMIVADPGKMSR